MSEGFENRHYEPPASSVVANQSCSGEGTY